jgi:hypothetical protein
MAKHLDTQVINILIVKRKKKLTRNKFSYKQKTTNQFTTIQIGNVMSSKEMVEKVNE